VTFNGGKTASAEILGRSELGPRSHQGVSVSNLKPAKLVIGRPSGQLAKS
jgi:hypothetical protein